MSPNRNDVRSKLLQKWLITVLRSPVSYTTHTHTSTRFGGSHIQVDCSSLSYSLILPIYLIISHYYIKLIPIIINNLYAGNNYKSIHIN